MILCSTNSQRINFGQTKRFTLGGLFPVHSKGQSNDSNACGPILKEKGIQRLEAMLFAVKQINSNYSYWRFNLDPIPLDTCSSDTYALEQSLQFLQTCKDSHGKKVTGVVGAANSDVSAALASIFKPFKVPQISYASTSEKLNDLNKYPYFFRVVPSDKFQVRVMLDILTEFKWSYVSAVTSKDDYGSSAIENLQALMSLANYEEICFAEIQMIPDDDRDDHYIKATRALLQHENVKVVIVFLHEEKVRKLFSAFKGSNAPINRFVWLGSDAWGAKSHPVRGHEAYAEGAITILPKRFPISGFDEYFLSLKPDTHKENPWFKEFWEAQFNCTFNKTSKKQCTGDENLASGYRQEGLVPMVIDAVYVLATALKALCSDYPKLCRNTENNNLELRKLLKDYIAKTNFTSVQGNNMELNFDSNRDIEAKYSIYQYQRSSRNSTKFDYKLIGEWVNSNNTKDSKLSMKKKPVWEGKGEFISSICSRACVSGEERIYNRDRKRRCCWECRRCQENFYLPNPHGNCQECPEGQLPTTDFTECTDMELKYLGKDLLDPWPLVPLCFSVFGLLCTFTIFIIFLYFRNTPIIMASGRELCYVILAGVALCYCFTFFAISRPSKFMCSVVRMGMGLGMSVCYSAIITKTNRTSRIFNRRLRTAKRPSYISPESQLVICLCLILIQITLSVMWLFVKPPSTKAMFVEAPPEWILKCGFGKFSVLFGLLYNMVLLVFCTFYAFKTRNIPENFNESKYISFTMYSSCIIWLAFIPIYCSAMDDYKVQITVLSMSVSLSGSVTLACIFLPKIYVVIFRPEKNVRYPSSNTNSGATTTYVTPAPIRFKRVPKTSHTLPPSEDFQNDLLANKCLNHPHAGKI
ncbi:metabotropic glutamate receptor 3-like [Uloborus diversus]|uniref:metabotropic glutamate receptor 3-like n=1 Tax=Uloborus diversus TaxID=327109 RepID=UPI00240A712D|nr:metabotropic glutamate receptor 3-like [Uloborus diversus]